MKRYVLIALLTGMFLPIVALSQEFEPGPEPEHQMHLWEMELELQNREARMDIERRMAELELEKRKIEIDRMRKAHLKKLHKKELHPLLLLCAVVHILAAVWVYQDIRKRNAGSGIWIVITILTGLLGVLVYAIVRLGETGEKK